MADLAASFRLDGRVALVTGSSRGIGRSLALALAQAGADIAVHYATRAADAEAVVAEIEGMGRRAAAFKAELGDPAACRSLIGNATVALGPPDILILNGSTEIRRDWREIGEDDFATQVAVNLQSTVLLLQGAVPAMV